MSKRVYKKKITVLLLCSWVIFTSNSAVAMSYRGCMDCASFAANIAKIFDTVYKFFVGSGNSGSNNTKRESIVVEAIEEEYIGIQYPNGTSSASKYYKRVFFTHSY